MGNNSGLKGLNTFSFNIQIHMLLPILLPLGLCPAAILPLPSIYIPDSKQPLGLKSKLINTLNAELNPISHFQAVFGTHHMLYVSRIEVNITTKLYIQFMIPGAAWL
jgi:hypothetical protein